MASHQSDLADRGYFRCPNPPCAYTSASQQEMMAYFSQDNCLTRCLNYGANAIHPPLNAPYEFDRAAFSEHQSHSEMGGKPYVGGASTSPSPWSGNPQFGYSCSFTQPGTQAPPYWSRDTGPPEPAMSSREQTYSRGDTHSRTSSPFPEPPSTSGAYGYFHDAPVYAALPHPNASTQGVPTPVATVTSPAAVPTSSTTGFEQCRDCDKKYSGKGARKNLQRHRHNNHRDDGRPRCNACNSSFTRDEYRRRHEKKSCRVLAQHGPKHQALAQDTMLIDDRGRAGSDT